MKINPNYIMGVCCVGIIYIVSMLSEKTGEGYSQLLQLRSEYDLILQNIPHTQETEDHKADHYAYIVSLLPETNEGVVVLPILQQRLKQYNWRFVTKVNDSFIYCKGNNMFELLPPSHNVATVKEGQALKQQIDLINIEIMWGRSYISEFCK